MATRVPQLANLLSAGNEKGYSLLTFLYILCRTELHRAAPVLSRELAALSWSSTISGVTSQTYHLGAREDDRQFLPDAEAAETHRAVRREGLPGLDLWR